MLEILGLTYNDLPPVVPVAGTISGDGATIGRGRENAIILPDPKRLVSRQHLKFILGEGGKYLVCNISSGNSVFINDAELTPGMECPLQDYDKILVGGYVLQVTYVAQGQKGTLQARTLPVDAGSDDFLAELLGSAAVEVKPVTPGSAAGRQGEIPDPFMFSSVSEKNDIMQMLNERGVEPGSLDSKGDGLINSKDPSMTVDELLLDPLNVPASRLQKHDSSLDPLAMFDETGNAGEFGDILQPTRGAVPSVSSDVDLTRSELNAFFHLPDTSEKTLSVPPGTTPAVPDIANRSVENAGSDATEFDDIDNIIAGLGSGSAPTFGTVQPVDDPLSAFLSDSTPANFNLPPPPASNMAVPPVSSAPFGAPTVLPEIPSIPPSVSSASRMPSAPSSAEPSTAPCMEELYQAFIEGLGMELPGRGALDKAFMNMLGQVLRNYTQGTVDLIAGRTVVKQAVRANLTVIAPDRNNPLKFSPDGNTALMSMFGRSLPGFMGPIEAVRNAYVDLRAHQIGVISGMQAALNNVLDRFNPAVLGDKIPPRGVLENMLPVMHRARLWSEYRHYFYVLREKASDHFQEFFGQAFLEAYEKAILTVQSGERTGKP
ncbi:MAG: type VI secretion system-associated FHA domain protein TagH [Betaproteobacteria bacterium]|nr:type VI secretion system-associated FHA domain protein TagH [Betaproteobacteria bacterium]